MSDNDGCPACIAEAARKLYDHGDGRVCISSDDNKWRYLSPHVDGDMLVCRRGHGDEDKMVPAQLAITETPGRTLLQFPERGIVWSVPDEVAQALIVQSTQAVQDARSAVVRSIFEALDRLHKPNQAGVKCIHCFKKWPCPTMALFQPDEQV